MLRRIGLKFMAFALLGLATFAAPANAAPVVISEFDAINNPNPYVIEPGKVYTDGGTPTPVEYHFVVNSVPSYEWLPVITVSSGGGTDPAGEPFKITWIDTLTNSILANAVVVAANDPLFLPQLLAGHTYTLIFEAAANGSYFVNLTTTPLPPALILFGTALAGLGWLGRRRRAASAGV
jgi:uncharacterized protein (TIGR03382 family)